MKSLASRLIPALLLLGVAGCSKPAEPPPAPPPPPPSVALVPAAELSPNFKAVTSHLELGGTLYAYADIDGDALSFATSAQSMVKSLVGLQPQLSMYAKLDYKDVFTTLGLDDVKAIGVSSVHEASGAYRNRTFLYTPKGRHGFLAAFGGDPAPFTYARLAPADTDFYAEHEYNLKAAYDTIEALVAKANGPDAATSFRASVQKVGIDAHLSLLELINGLTGRIAVVLRFDPVKNVALPGPSPVTLPAMTFLLRVDGIGAAVETALKAKAAHFSVTSQGTMTVYASTADTRVDGLKPVLAVDGAAFYVASSREFLTECLARTAGLDTNPVFKADLAALGGTGNGLTWVTPRFLGRLRDMTTMNTTVPPPVHKFLETISNALPSTVEPMLSVRTNLPDGILIRSEWNRSLKTDLAMAMVYNPVTLGMMTAMAIPAFQKVRMASQTTAVQANLRTLALAADQYYQDYGASSANYDDLVGPDRPLKSLTPVVGEDYRSVKFLKGRRLFIRLPDGRMVSDRASGARAPAEPNPLSPLTADSFGGGSAAGATPAPEPTVPQDPNERIILRQMGRLRLAANAFYRRTGMATATYDQLVGPGKLIPRLTPVEGEDYKTIPFVQGQPLQLALPNGRVLILPEEP